MFVVSLPQIKMDIVLSMRTKNWFVDDEPKHLGAQDLGRYFDHGSHYLLMGKESGVNLATWCLGYR